MIALDLHIHSRFSEDSLLHPATIVRVARRLGLDGVAVVDHGTVAGGLAARRYAQGTPLLVIPGAEYATPDGHVLGLFLEDDTGLPPWGATLTEAVTAIRQAGGLAILAHPFKRRVVADRILQAVDAVEAANARAWIGAVGPAAEALCGPAVARLGMAVTAGSDAHTAREIGRGVLRLPLAPGSAAGEVREAIMAGAGWPMAGRTHPCVEAYCQIIKACRRRSPRHVARSALLLGLAGVGLWPRRQMATHEAEG